MILLEKLDVLLLKLGRDPLEVWHILVDLHHYFFAVVGRGRHLSVFSELGLAIDIQKLRRS